MLGSFCQLTQELSHRRMPRRSSHYFYPFCKTLNNQSAVGSISSLRVRPVVCRTKEKDPVLSHKVTCVGDMFSACLNAIDYKGASNKLFNLFSHQEMRSLRPRNEWTTP